MDFCWKALIIMLINGVIGRFTRINFFIIRTMMLLNKKYKIFDVHNHVFPDNIAEKFMFGTDYPMWRHRDELDRFLRLNLSEAEREAILYNNAAKLFGEA
jgi:hypothetical protein